MNSTDDLYDYLLNNSLCPFYLEDININNLTFNSVIAHMLGNNSVHYREATSQTRAQEYLKQGYITRNSSPLAWTIYLSNLGQNSANKNVGTIDNNGNITWEAEGKASFSLPGYGYAVKVGEVAILTTDNYNLLRKALRKIGYDNSTSGLTATTLPDAIDELATKINSLVDGNEVSY